MPHKIVLEDCDSVIVAAGEYDFGGSINPPYPTYVKWRGDIYMLQSSGSHLGGSFWELIYRRTYPNICRAIDDNWGRDKSQWPNQPPNAMTLIRDPEPVRIEDPVFCP